MTHETDNAVETKKPKAKAKAAGGPKTTGNGLATGLQPGETAPGGGPGASVGSMGTGGGSTGGSSTGNA